MHSRALFPFVAFLAFTPPPHTGRTARLPAASDTAAIVVRAAKRAVEGDSAGPMRARWEARLRRDPADREARLGIATIARRTFDYDRADREYAEILKSSPRVDGVALQARLGAAHVEQYHRSFPKAESLFRRALAEARAAGDTTAQVEATIGIGHSIAVASGPRAARMLLDSVAGLVAFAAADIAGEYHCVRGFQVYLEGGADAEAEERRGLLLARQSGSRWVEGICLTHLGGRSMTTGNIAGAFALYDSAERVQRAAHDRWNLATTFIWRSFLDLELYDHGAALRDVTAALEQADSAGAPLPRAWALRGLAHIEWHTSDLTAASIHLAQASTLMKQIGEERGYAALRVIIGGVALDRGEVAEAERHFQEDLAWADAAGLKAIAFNDRHALVQVAMRRRDWSLAATRMRDLAAYGQRHSLTGWIAGLEYDLGLIAMRQGDLSGAERHFRRHLVGGGKDQRVDHYSARSRLAEVHLARGDAHRAAAELTSATDELDSLRGTLDERGLRVQVFQTHRGYDDADVGFATVIGGLVRAGESDVALELAERRRARQLADGMSLARSLNTASPARVPTLAAPFQLKRLQAAIPDDRTALVEFVAGGSGQPSSVFLVSRESVRAFAVPSLDSLRPLIEEFATAIKDVRAAPSSANRLRAALFDSVLATIPAAVQRLVIVPDGALHAVPFDALPLASGEPMMIRYAIAEAPSLAIVEALWRRPPNSGAAQVLAIGDPAFVANEALPRLPGSAREAKRMAAFSADGEARLRSAASEEWLKHADLNPFAVIHLATHALVDQRSAIHTSLVLAPGGGEDGFLAPWEIAALHLRADLVVLSACRTAGGVIVGGEGMQGLTGPLLEAGAGSIMATLWPTGDESTFQLVDGFYRGLARGLDVLDALHAAKLDARSRGSPASHWAGFILVGNPSVHIPLHDPPRSNLGLAGLGALIVLATILAWRLRRR